MRTGVGQDQQLSLMRLLEMLVDRFGAFEAIAYSSIKLARFAPPDELAMDPLVANAILEFGDDLRYAAEAASNGQPRLKADMVRGLDFRQSEQQG
jgi:hypothetical protein